MKNRKHKKTDGEQEFKPFSFIKPYRPTIEMAAELINVSVNVIEEWLSRDNYSLDEDGFLTDAAIDYLGEKYVSRLHKYFDNCVTAGENLDDKERNLFNRFKSKYGKIYRFHIEKWSDIDTKRIAKDFKQELNNTAADAYFRGFENLDFSAYIVHAQEAILDTPTTLDVLTRQERAILLFELSHSLYYGSRIKTKIPGQPEYRNIVLEILQENRFHIFTGESDSNALFDAFLSSNVKQPQIAIANVFGSLWHKNVRFHESQNQTQAHYCS